MEEREYSFIGTVADIREALGFLQDTGLLDPYQVGFDGDRLIDTQAPGFEVRFTIQPRGMDGGTLIVVRGQSEAWEELQGHLLRQGWAITPVSRQSYTTVVNPYVDPSQIKKASHRRVIELLIDRHLGRNRLTNEELAEQAGVSRSQFYEIRKRYTTDDRLQRITGPAGEEGELDEMDTSRTR